LHCKPTPPFLLLTLPTLVLLVSDLFCRQAEAASRDPICLHSVRITSTYMQKLTDTHTFRRYWQCLPGTPSPPPPEVAAGTYLSGKTALFPDSEGGLTGFTPLDPVLPSQNWTVTGTGMIIWPFPPPLLLAPPSADCVSVQPYSTLGTLPGCLQVIPGSSQAQVRSSNCSVSSWLTKRAHIWPVD